MDWAWQGLLTLLIFHCPLASSTFSNEYHFDRLRPNIFLFIEKLANTTLMVILGGALD